MKTCPVCGGRHPDDVLFCPQDGSALRSDGAELLGGVIAERYKIVEKIGEGGMGTVYLGVHVKMGRKSAIKIMSRAMARDPDAVARFNREAANAARISHPNVCAIYDFGDTRDGIIYLAMEFVEGQPLSALLRPNRGLPPNRATAILEQTAAALEAAHELGIVHRDLKPDNIMLARTRDGDEVVKVVDFGIAKAAGGEEGQDVTRTGFVVGTPEYMSPEQLTGGALDGRSDIYALGIVLFRMLTGTLPFQAASPREAMVKRLIDPPLSLGEAAPGRPFPPGLQRALDRALSHAPDDRYASAGAFARDVREALGAGAGRAADGDAATLMMAPDHKTVATTRVRPTPAAPEPAPAAHARADPRSMRARRAVAYTGAVVLLAAGATAVVIAGGAGGGGASGPTAAESLGVAPGSDRAAGEIERAPAGARADAETADGAGARPPGVDTAAVAAQIVVVGRRIAESATRGAARDQLRQWHDNARLPAFLRARAASYVAESYDAEHDRRPAEACRWIDRAIALDPTNDIYRQTRTIILGCAP